MTRDAEVVDERHPFRFLVKFAVFAGLIFFAGRFLAQKKDEYADLTESEAREKLVDKMAPRVGDDTAEEIADQVIPKLKDRGLIKADPMEAAAEKVVDTAKNAKKKTEDAVDTATDKVTKAVDSVVKD
jgi:hypothetical protein